MSEKAQRVKQDYPTRHRTLDAELLTAEELRQKLNLPHVNLIDRMRRGKKLPCVKLGYRTIRYDWPRVRAALDKLAIKEVGA